MGFSDATALTQIDPQTWAGAIEQGWDVMGNANGGYLLAIAARAGALASGRSDPVSITGHFLSPGKAGPITVSTEAVKTGRRFSTVRADLFDTAGRRLVSTLGSYSDLNPAGDVERIGGAPPDLPPPEDCVRLEPTATFPPPLLEHIDLRLHPDDLPVEAPDRNTTPRVRGWFRWADHAPIDSLSLIVATDAFPPTTFNAGLPIAWTPTLELTAHVRVRPQPDAWLRCAFSTRFITGGFLEEDGEVWGDSGRLIAQSRQLALLPLAP